MSHYEVFKAPKEKVEKLKAFSSAEKINEFLANTKKELLVFCMKKNTNTETYKAISSIRFYLESIRYYVDIQTRNLVYEQYCADDEQTFWFCGWEYSRPYDAPNMDSVTEYVIEKLILLSEVVETPNFFNEQEDFYEKVNAINNEIEYFCDSVATSTDFQIMEEFKEWKVKDGDNKDDYNDIYNDSEEVMKQQESSNNPIELQ